MSFRIFATTSYGGDNAINVEVGDKIWQFLPRVLQKAIGLLHSFANGNPCDFPNAELFVSEQGWRVIVGPQSLYPEVDNSSAEFSVRDFIRMPQNILENPTMLGLQEYAKTLNH